MEFELGEIRLSIVVVRWGNGGGRDLDGRGGFVEFAVAVDDGGDERRIRTKSSSTREVEREGESIGAGMALP